jgi:hypothetical protein
MKPSDGTKIIQAGWVVKPKGFRVRYQKFVDSELVTEYSPGLEENPQDSDVGTWRYAWKLFMATKTEGPDIAEGEFVNICVVNDLDVPIEYYVTCKKEIFNPKSMPPITQD